MVLPSTVTLKFEVNPFCMSAAALATAIGPSNVPLDPNLGLLAGVTVTSDSAASAGGQAVRTIVCNLQQPVFFVTPVGLRIPAGVQSQIRVWSTSPFDNASSGAQSVTLTYTDAAGGGHTETINLKGKTKVLSTGVNYAAVSAAVPNSATGVMNQGDIYLETVPIPNTVRGVYQMGVLTQGFFSRNPVVGLWAKPFIDWVTNAIRAAVGPCIPVNPVFS